MRVYQKGGSGNRKTELKLISEKRFFPAGNYTVTPPVGTTQMDFFLVGGGGGGGSWVTWGYSVGGPGGGGQCITYKNVPIHLLEKSFNIRVGAGGGTETNGQSTIIYGLGVNYVANGGGAGKRALNQPTNEQCLSICGEGGNPGINDGFLYVYDKGNVYKKNGTIIASGITATIENPYTFRTGMREFDEPNGKLNAAGAVCGNNVIPITDYEEGKGVSTLGGDQSTQIWSGGGYGGGGAGGYYRGGADGKKGGDGTIIIRYYTEVIV